MRTVLRAVIVSVISALVAGVLASAPSAAASVGRVTGTMTGPGGAEPVGVAQVRVELYRKTARGWYYRGQELLGEGETDFSFKIAKAGTYMVRAKPKAGPYTVGQSRAFKGGPGRDVSGVRVALERSAAIAGTVTGVPTDSPKRGALQLWRWKDKRWVKGRSQAVAAHGRYIFGVKPGKFRIRYAHLEGRFWAPTTKTITVRGRKMVSGVDVVLRESKTVSGALTRVGFTGRSHVSAEVRTARGWREIYHDYRARDTYSIAVPGARPQVRVMVWGDGPIWSDGPDADHPTVFWNGSVTGVLAAKRAKTIDLAAGSAAGVDFTLRAYREFDTTMPLRIAGTSKVGAKLKAAGAWSPKPTRVRYQWRRGGDVIKGATAGTYRLRKADRGRRVWVSVAVERGWYRPIEIDTKRVLIR
jgi:hypothetical protein